MRIVPLVRVLRLIIYKNGNKVIYTKQETWDNSPRLIALNTENGEKGNSLLTETSEFHGRTVWQPYNNLVGMSTGSTMFGLNLNSLTKNWRFKATNSSGASVDHFGQYLFVPLIDYKPNNKEIKVLVRFDVTTGKSDTLSVESEVDNFTLVHVIPKSVVNTQNDTIVYIASTWKNNTTRTGGAFWQYSFDLSQPPPPRF